MDEGKWEMIRLPSGTMARVQVRDDVEAVSFAIHNGKEWDGWLVPIGDAKAVVGWLRKIDERRSDGEKA